MSIIALNNEERQVTAQLEFRNPPAIATPQPSYPYNEWAEQTKARPGEWAYLGRLNKSIASRINTGGIAAFPRYRYEATCRSAGSDPAKGDIYLKYTGPVPRTGDPYATGQVQS